MRFSSRAPTAIVEDRGRTKTPTLISEELRTIYITTPHPSSLVEVVVACTREERVPTVTNMVLRRRTTIFTTTTGQTRETNM